MSLADEILALYAARGAGAYFGEQVSMREHALQAAHFAVQAGAAEPLVLAALLHDIGHLLEDVPAAIEDWKHDARHEVLGGRWLARHFGSEISEPVRLHVPAKRYLCATDPRYLTLLSDASLHTLQLQGGPMSRAEVAAFEAEPGAEHAVRVRQFDDQGKVRGLTTPALEEYRALIERAAHGQAPRA